MIQIVIKLSDKIYDTILDDEMPTNEQMKVIVQRIYEGVPLPKGCGSLIDTGKVREKINGLLKEPDYQHDGEDWRSGLNMAEELIYDAPTIIEADTESEDDK